MEGYYSVSFANKNVGKVQVQRQGLYYRFICRCSISGDVVCRLKVVCGGREESLGVVIPMEGGFGLDTRLPVKRIGEGNMEFYLAPKGLPLAERAEPTEPAGQFVPIYPDEPFAYIARLKQAFFVRQNGQAGILIK